MRRYAQYVSPHLEFCSPASVSMDRDGKRQFWKRYREELSLRYRVSGLKGNIYEDNLRDLEMLTLEERRHQADMVPTFKIIRGVYRYMVFFFFVYL